MPRIIKKYLLWIFYVVFLVLAFLFGARESLLFTTSEFAAGKYVVFVIFAGFVAYSLYATYRENFFKTVRVVNSMFWGLQIGIDLYISVFLSLGLIYLVEGSLLVVALWFVPILIFANLAILPYILLNYGAIVSHFA